MNTWFTSYKALGLIVLLCMATSCIYEPFGDYDNPVETNIPVPGINDLDLTLNQDTVWVYGNGRLMYHFSTTNDKQQVLGLMVYLDGQLKDSVYSSTGSFNIEQAALSEGNHSLKVVLYVKTGNGSIADRLNAEAIILTKEWMLIADYTPRKIVDGAENGYLTLQWEPYKNKDIKAYIIDDRKRIIDNTYTDSLYFGIDRTYSVKVEKRNGDIIPWATIQLDNRLPKISVRQTDNYRYMVYWNKSPYYNAVESYSYELVSSSIGYSAMGTFTVDDTSIITNLRFYDEFYVHLYTQPKSGSYTPGYLESSFYGYAGKSVIIRNNTWYTSPDTLVALDNEKIIRYTLDNRFVSSHQLVPGKMVGINNIQLSAKGSYLIGKEFISQTSGSRLFVKNMLTDINYPLDVVDSCDWSVDQQYGQNISETGRAVVICSDREYVMDFIQKKIVATRYYSPEEASLHKVENYNRFYVRMSPDGLHYIETTANRYNSIVSIKVYKVGSSSIEHLYNLDTSFLYFQFNPLDPNRIVTYKSGQLSVIQCDPYTFLYKIDSNEYFMNVDFFNNEMLFISNARFVIRDLTTGAIIKTIPRNNNPVYSFDTYILHNHQIIKGNQLLEI